MSLQTKCPERTLLIFECEGSDEHIEIRVKQARNGFASLEITMPPSWHLWKPQTEFRSERDGRGGRGGDAALR